MALFRYVVGIPGERVGKRFHGQPERHAAFLWVRFAMEVDQMGAPKLKPDLGVVRALLAQAVERCARFPGFSCP